ncbi:MAG: hypothetical protein ABEH65_09705 [Halobacteriales archaeon]
MVGKPAARSDRTSRILFVLLLLLVATTAAVVAEAEMNYASSVKADQAVATVSDTRRTNGGLQVRLQIENPLNRPLRIQYVSLSISDGDDLATVGIPYTLRDSLPPGTSQLTVAAGPRYLQSVSLNGTIWIKGHIAVEVYNDFDFNVQIRRTEITP